MSELPERVVVGANGAYWRDFGTHYSMCPVSDDNDPVEAVATYVRLPAPDERQVGLREALTQLRDAAQAYRGRRAVQWDDPTEEPLTNALIVAGRALAAPAEEERLDVERLAKALHEMEGPGKHSRPRHTRQICPGPGHHTADAERVAAEYRALGDESKEEG